MNGRTVSDVADDVVALGCMLRALTTHLRNCTEGLELAAIADKNLGRQVANELQVLADVELVLTKAARWADDAGFELANSELNAHELDAPLAAAAALPSASPAQVQGP